MLDCELKCTLPPSKQPLTAITTKIFVGISFYQLCTLRD